MKKQVATLCCVILVQGSLVTAEQAMTANSTANAPAVRVTSAAGPLRTASLSKDATMKLVAAGRQTSQPVADDDRDRGPWIERHPVWTGAMVGFAAGFLITYAAAHEDQHALFTPVDPGGPALVFGAVAAGVGALAGWGVGRNRDKGYPDRRGAAVPTGRHAESATSR
jgi:hypothetical protein